MSPITEQVPVPLVRPSKKSSADLPGPSGNSWGKRKGNRKRKEKETTPPTLPSIHEEDEDSETRNLFPPYIPIRRVDALKVKIQTKLRAPLVEAIVPKGFKVLKNILLNLQDLSFDE